MNLAPILIVLIAVYVICRAPSCPRMPPTTTTRPAILTVKDFINGCKAGNEWGVTNSDVNYTVRVKVRPANGNNFDNSVEVFNEIFNAPPGDDKGIFIQNIKVVNGPFYLRVTLDGKDCSLCAKGGCNPINFQGYQINNAPPYWQTTRFFDNSSLFEYVVVPTVGLRNPTGSQTCNCKIKL